MQNKIKLLKPIALLGLTAMLTTGCLFIPFCPMRPGPSVVENHCDSAITPRIKEKWFEIIQKAEERAEIEREKTTSQLLESIASKGDAAMYFDAENLDFLMNGVKQMYREIPQTRKSLSKIIVCPKN